MNLTIWWVRHGPTHRKEMVGWTDLPADLSDKAALARLDAYLPDAPVISSDLTRAVATADAIQGARPRLAHAPGLREIHFGAWELLTADALEARDPEKARAYWTDPTHVRPPGGESFADLATRVNAAVDTLARHAGPDGNLIAVAHFGVILSQLHRARQGTMTDLLAQHVDNLSVTALRRDADGWHETLANHRP
ncbi:MAG: histidine phosphatase family protein [Maritimibacter sp.]|nr:histidine phosphatase family protein [Maritimibacter sp.]